MDTRTGEIITQEEADKRNKEAGEVVTTPISKQDARNDIRVLTQDKSTWKKPVKVCRNDACPCGSEKKFKNCCMTEYNSMRDDPNNRVN